jgi:hypothetical protein
MNFKKILVMKKIVLILVMAVSGIFNALNAQDRPFLDDKKEEIEAMKIGFLTRRLNLSPEEAKTFWPVYNMFANDLQALRKNRREEKRHAKDEFLNMSDKEVEKLVDGEIAFKQSELDIIKKYHAQFKQVLPMKKIAILYKSEEEFKLELLKKIQERRQDNPKRPGMR